jgi:hypothetical protein
MEKIINKWLKLIPKKEILNIKLDDNLTKLYNTKTNLNYIIIFDVEFIRYAINNRQVQTIHELGGIILAKKENNWYLVSIFHCNLIPIIKNIKQYYLLTSNYNTVSNETYNKLLENEKNLLPENIILIKEDLDLIKHNRIINRYLSKKILTENFDTIKKKISKIKYMIKGSDLNGDDYKLFKKNIELILNDSECKSRQISENNQKEFIKLTNYIFSNSYLIVKGLEDIKALKNHTLMLNEISIKLNNFFDIAQYNNYLFKKCGSAELGKTYLCLEKLKLTQQYNNYLSIINKFTNMKVHNPLVDAYYTWIIFNLGMID